MFVRTWTDPIYRIEISIIVCDLDELRAYMHRRFPDFNHDGSFERVSLGKSIKLISNLGWTDYAIWLPQWSESDGDISALLHESLHVTADALRQKGLTLSEASEEAYTYYQEYIFRTCLQHLRKHHERTKERRTRRTGRAR